MGDKIIVIVRHSPDFLPSMASRCPGVFCKSSRDRNRRVGTNISFHRFPKDEARKAVWLKVCLPGFVPNGNSLLCCRHFEPSQFFIDPTRKRRKLNYDAVPSLVYRLDNGEKVIDVNDQKLKPPPKLESQSLGTETMPEIETIWFSESTHPSLSEHSVDSTGNSLDTTTNCDISLKPPQKRSEGNISVGVFLHFYN